MPLPLPVTGRLWAGRSRRPPEGRAGKGKGKGCAEPGPLSAPAPPHPAGGSRSGFLAPPAPGANSVAVRTPRIQTSTPCAVHGEAGCRGRRAPGRERTAASTCRPAPPLGGAPVTGVQAPPTHPRLGAHPPRPSAPGGREPALPVLAVPPGPSRPPSPSAGRAAPPARALRAAPARRPHSHSASTSSRGATSSASRCTPRRRRRSCCRRLEPAAGSDGQGRGRESLGRAAGGAQLAGRGGAEAAAAAGRGRGGGPAAARAHSLPARTRPGPGGGATAGRRRALATPTARRAPGRRPGRHKQRRAPGTPRPRCAGTPKPAAGRAPAPFCFIPEASSRTRGWRPRPGGSGGGVRGRGCAPGRQSVLHRGGRQEGTRRRLESPIPEFRGSVGQVLLK